MTLDNWIEATIVRLNEADGDFAPVIANPATLQVRTLAGVPADVSHSEALQGWMAQLGVVECFFAVKESESLVMVGRKMRDDAVFAAIEHIGGVWSSRPAVAPTWWRD